LAGEVVVVPNSFHFGWYREPGGAKSNDLEFCAEAKRKKTKEKGAGLAPCPAKRTGESRYESGGRSKPVDLLMGISRSWTALAHQLETLAVITKSKGK
jgi:hypothetical protein